MHACQTTVVARNFMTLVLIRANRDVRSANVGKAIALSTPGQGTPQGRGGRLGGAGVSRLGLAEGASKSVVH